MSPAHLHLMFNHLPVIGVPLVAALLAWGIFRRNRDVTRTALGAAVAIAALSYPVFLTGEGAENQVEDSAWMSEPMVHEHEERGEAALIATLLVGTLAAFGLWQSRAARPVSGGVAGITLAGLGLSAALFGWTALAGGQIRHDEIRPGPMAAHANDAPGVLAHDDDDN